MKSNTIIIDSSVIAKWYLPDEPSESASRIKLDLIARIIQPAAPLLIYYEVNNVIRSASLSFRMNQKEAKKAYSAFLELNFTVYHSRQLLEKALEKALELDISSYDASYTCLAEYLQVPFYTADEKLVAKAQDKLVKNLEEYPFKLQF